MRVGLSLTVLGGLIAAAAAVAADKPADDLAALKGGWKVADSLQAGRPDGHERRDEERRGADPQALEVTEAPWASQALKRTGHATAVLRVQRLPPCERAAGLSLSGCSGVGAHAPREPV
jgi:hypothetical protein